MLYSDWSYLTASRTVSQPTNLPSIETNNVNVGGNSRWLGTSTVSWRNGHWSGALGAYYVGSSQDGASTTQAVYDSLGQPGYLARHFTEGRYVYRYLVHDFVTFNATLGYRFGGQARDWFRGVSVRLA